LKGAGPHWRVPQFKLTLETYGAGQLCGGRLSCRKIAIELQRLMCRMMWARARVHCVSAAIIAPKAMDAPANHHALPNIA